MSWEQIELDSKENKKQLWSKIKRLEKKLEEKNEFIVGLRQEQNERIEELGDKHDKEIAELKHTIANLRRSNAMLKKFRKINTEV